MSSLYAQYLTERTGDSILETSQGYATFRFLNNGKTVYIVDIFVLPEFRKLKVASELADQIAATAKEKGCVEMIGTVVPSTKNSTTSLRVLLGYGMTLSGANNDIVIFRKDI